MHDVKSFWERVNSLIKSNSSKQETLASECGINYQTFRGWVVHGTYPNALQTFLIASSLHTSVEYLVTGKHTDAESELIELKRKILELLKPIQ